MTPEALWQFITTYHRVTGHLPKLRECVDHFDGKLLNVQLSLLQLGKARSDELRRLGRAERDAANRQRDL